MLILDNQYAPVHTETIRFSYEWVDVNGKPMTREMEIVRPIGLQAASLKTGNPASAHKLNADQSVAVATDVFFNEDMATCPRGPKVQLLGVGGVATYGVYNGRDTFWIGWAPVPRRRPREQ